MNDMPSVCNVVSRRARSAHKCFGCGSKIEKGDSYFYTSGIWDRRPLSFKHCEHCHKIINDFRNMDDDLSYEDGPPLNFYGVSEWINGFICCDWSGGVAAKDIAEIFSVPFDYAKNLIGLEGE